jgi:hypothetical protein
MADEDFSNAPVSIAELRALKGDKAKDWSPRDALVRTLRQIDSGEINPINLVMIFETEDEYREVISTEDIDKTLALYARGLYMRNLL